MRSLLILTLLTAVLSITIPVTEQNLLPEGIEWNYLTGKFLVGSLFQGKISQVDSLGRIETLTAGDAAQGLTSSVGLQIDPNDDYLHVANGYPVIGSSLSQYLRINLATGDIINSVNLTNIGTSTTHFANDLAVDHMSNVYITDSFGSQIWKVETSGTATTFVESELFNPPTGFVGLNGIEYHHSGILITGVTGNTTENSPLFRINITDQSIHEIVLDGGVIGIDGIYMEPYNANLIYVVGAGNVSKIQSTDGWWTAKVIQSMPTSANCVTPTTFTLGGDNWNMFVTCLNNFGSSGYVIDQVEFPALPYPDVINYDFPYLAPEGIEVYNGRIIVGSLGGGFLSYVNPDGSLRPLTRFSSPNLFASAGIEVDYTNGYIHIANTLFPPDASASYQASYVRYNMQSEMYDLNVDLTTIGSASLPHLANDLAVDSNGNVYITDSAGQQIWKVTPAGVGSSLVSSAAFAADPTTGIGLNGIVYHPLNLLLTVLSGTAETTKLFKVGMDGNYEAVTVDGTFWGPDGIVFSPNSTYELYAVGGQYIWHLQTTTEWQTARVVRNFTIPSSCITPTTLAFLGEYEVFVSCANGFGSGPYAVQKLFVDRKACPANSVADSSFACNCREGYNGQVDWNVATQEWESTCQVVTCPSGSANDGSGLCQCTVGFEGSLLWEPSAQVYEGDCVAVTCPTDSAGSSLGGSANCICNTGYYGSIGWDSNSQVWTGGCQVRSCPVDTTNTTGACTCNTGFYGQITWNLTSQNWDGACQVRSCPSSSTTGSASCSCNVGFYGQITWNATTQNWDGMCQARSCPTDSTGVSCACAVGFYGQISWNATTQDWNGQCQARSCPADSVSGSSSCACAIGFYGQITWNSTTQNWDGVCSARACPSDSTGTNACTCDVGFYGQITWNSTTQNWDGRCLARACPSDSDGSTSCTCNVGFYGSVSWNAATQNWDSTCQVRACPPNGNADAMCACQQGYQGTTMWNTTTQDYDGSCMMVTCPDDSTGGGVAGCVCAIGYYGDIAWNTANQGYDGDCAVRACPPNADADAMCACQQGYQGVPMWNTTTQDYDGSCRLVVCPANADGGGVAGCACVTGYYGDISWNATVQGYDGNCAVRSCPSNSTWMVMTTAQCDCNVGFYGQISWNQTIANWQGQCTVRLCPSEYVSDSTGCACSGGANGDVSWNSTSQNWVGECTGAGVISAPSFFIVLATILFALLRN